MVFDLDDDRASRISYGFFTNIFWFENIFHVDIYDTWSFFYFTTDT